MGNYDRRWEGRNTFHTDLADKMQVFVSAEGEEGLEGGGFPKLETYPFMDIHL